MDFLKNIVKGVKGKAKEKLKIGKGLDSRLYKNRLKTEEAFRLLRPKKK